MASLQIGMEHPPRPGYALVAFCRSKINPVAGKRIFPIKGKAFSIWKKVA